MSEEENHFEFTPGMEIIPGQYLYHGTNADFSQPQDGTYFGLQPAISIFILIEKIHNCLLEVESKDRMKRLQNMSDVTLQTYIVTDSIKVPELEEGAKDKISHVKQTNIWSGLIDWEDCNPNRDEKFNPSFEDFLNNGVFDSRFYASALMVPEPEMVLFGDEVEKITLTTSQNYNPETLYQKYWQWELKLHQEWIEKGIKRNEEERWSLLNEIAMSFISDL